MDRLTAMRAFRAVVDCGSLSAAADRLETSSGAISKQLRALEEHLGVQLLQRSTRRQHLTEPGLAYYRRCCELLDGLDATERELACYRAGPQGLLRLNAPMAFGSLHLAPLLADFQNNNPDVSIELNLDDRINDILGEGYDCALRIVTALPDSRLQARHLAPVQRVLCAAPDYLAKHGTPQQPSDLLQHDCLTYSLASEGAVWSFSGPQGNERVTVRGSLVANTSIALREAALAGRGIILSATFIVGPDLRAGRLLPLLPDYRLQARQLYAVYPENRHLLPKVRACIDYLADAYAGPPWDG